MLKNLWPKIFKDKNEIKLSQDLRQILGVKPNNLNIFKTAFLHRSCSKKNDTGEYVNNERLEYLGDAILGAVIADHFFNKYPAKDEGFLTKMRSRIVNGEYLGILANKIGINEFIVARTGNQSINKHLYGDVFEAFIGAVFFDKGYKFTKKFIIDKIINKYVNLHEIESTDHNFKSRLLEWGQKNKKEIKFYTDHESSTSKRFISYVRIENSIFGLGTGTSKKEAEQNAAHETILEVILN